MLNGEVFSKASKFSLTKELHAIARTSCLSCNRCNAPAKMTPQNFAEFQTRCFR